jgi:hypothetical protein
MVTPEVTRRFWRKVQRSAHGCWLWTARVDRCGYGAFSISRREIVRAHRLSWRLAHGADAAHGCVLQRCGNHRCVRPDHLYLGSAHEIERRPRASRALPPAARGDRHWTRRNHDRVARGERSNLSKLREADVREIRRLHADGRRYAELSAMFGVVERSIYHIVRRQTWKHL